MPNSYWDQWEIINENKQEDIGKSSIFRFSSFTNSLTDNNWPALNQNITKDERI